MPQKKALNNENVIKSSTERKPRCGIIMPISAIDGLYLLIGKT
jgi:hypothetical protein